jgi:hypothetical protein
MRCPKCGGELSSGEAQGLVSEYMASLGAKGGRKRGASKARNREVMRRAALKRWGRKETKEGSAREKVTIEEEVARQRVEEVTEEERGEEVREVKRGLLW